MNCTELKMNYIYKKTMEFLFNFTIKKNFRTFVDNANVLICIEHCHHYFTYFTIQLDCCCDKLNRYLLILNISTLIKFRVI